MTAMTSLRDRKKLQTRHRLADVAARLFAERGYDAVSMLDVARAADVSEQTVYNYFPTKPELVLDRAEEIRERTAAVVEQRADGETPAEALRGLVHEDVARFVEGDAGLELGEYPAQCVRSAVLRRFALEERERRTQAIASSILATDPALPPLVAEAHAAALAAVISAVTDRIGRAVLDGTDRAGAAAAMRTDADQALDDLAASFRTTTKEFS